MDIRTLRDKLTELIEDGLDPTTLVCFTDTEMPKYSLEVHEVETFAHGRRDDGSASSFVRLSHIKTSNG